MGRRLLRGLLMPLLHHVPYRVWDSKEGLEVGKEAEISTRLQQYCREQYLAWASAVFFRLPYSAELLFFPLVVCSIVVSVHGSTALQKCFIFKYGSNLYHSGSRMMFSLLK